MENERGDMRQIKRKTVRDTHIKKREKETRDEGKDEDMKEMREGI